MKRLLLTALFAVLFLIHHAQPALSYGYDEVFMKMKNPKHPHIVAEWAKDNEGRKVVYINNQKWRWQVSPPELNTNGGAGSTMEMTYTVLGIVWSPSGRFLLISMGAWDEDNYRVFSGPDRALLVFDLFTKGLYSATIPYFHMGTNIAGHSPRWTGPNLLAWVEEESNADSDKVRRTNKRFDFSKGIVAPGNESYASLSYVAEGLTYATRSVYRKGPDPTNDVLTVFPVRHRGAFSSYLSRHRNYYQYPPLYFVHFCSSELEESTVPCKPGSWYLDFNLDEGARQASEDEEVHDSVGESLYLFLDRDTNQWATKVIFD